MGGGSGVIIKVKLGENEVFHGKILVVINNVHRCIIVFIIENNKTFSCIV